MKLGKSADPALSPLLLLDQLLPVYVDVLRELARCGAEWVQLDENLDDASRSALRRISSAKLSITHKVSSDHDT
ncbi:hypothetical protein AC629_36895 [Bradyrhizobium sp. NAS80.1]|nr:hypothetical protein AC629_36895 [Bradyrhizobium sp. NAS80.1]